MSDEGRSDAGSPWCACPARSKAARALENAEEKLQSLLTAEKVRSFIFSPCKSGFVLFWILRALVL